MKKIILFLLNFVILISFTACSHPQKERQEFKYTVQTISCTDVFFIGADLSIEYLFDTGFLDDTDVDEQATIEFKGEKYIGEHIYSSYFGGSYPAHFYKNDNGTTFLLDDNGNCLELSIGKDDMKDDSGNVLSESKCIKIATRFVDKYTNKLKCYDVKSEYSDDRECYIVSYEKSIMDKKYPTADKAEVWVHKTGNIIGFSLRNFGTIDEPKEPLFDEEKLNDAVKAKIEKIFFDCDNKEQLVHTYSDYKIIITKEGELAAICNVDTERRVYSDEEFVDGYEVNEDGYAVTESVEIAFIIK